MRPSVETNHTGWSVSLLVFDKVAIKIDWFYTQFIKPESKTPPGDNGFERKVYCTIVNLIFFLARCTLNPISTVDQNTYFANIVDPDETAHEPSHKDL